MNVVQFSSIRYIGEEEKIVFWQQKKWQMQFEKDLVGVTFAKHRSTPGKSVNIAALKQPFQRSNGSYSQKNLQNLYSSLHFIFLFQPSHFFFTKILLFFFSTSPSLSFISSFRHLAQLSSILSNFSCAYFYCPSCCSHLWNMTF